MTTGVVALAGGAASILFMPSCDPECEDRPKPSVILQIVADHPTADVPSSIGADEVWYEWTNEDGEKVSRQAECIDEDMEDMPGKCTEWLIGDGGPGVYDYHATVCGQQYDSSVTLDLNDDGCEVDTQMIELPVQGCAVALASESPPSQTPAAELDITQKFCTLEARPSVLVSVVGQIDSHLAPLPAARVFYEVHEPPTPKQPTNVRPSRLPEQPNSGEMPGFCLNETCSMFAAGFEQTGDFEVGAEVCGQVVRASVSVGETSNGCHVDTQHLQLMADASKCKGPQIVSTPPPPPKPECGTQMTASAFLSPVTDAGDFWMPHPTDNLYFIHEGIRHEGYCAQKAANGKCKWWVTGWGLTGRFEAFTETCDVETGVTYTVEMSEDGCHPETQFVPVFVDTHGCIRSAWPPEGNPPPKTPAIRGEISR